MYQCTKNVKKPLPKVKSIDQKKKNGVNTKISLLNLKQNRMTHKINCKQKNSKVKLQQRKTVPNIQISKSPSISKYSYKSKSKNKNESVSLNRIKKYKQTKIKASNKYENNQTKQHFLQKNKKSITSLVQNHLKHKNNNDKLLERKTHAFINTINNTCNISSLTNLNSLKNLQFNTQIATNQNNRQKRKKHKCKEQQKKNYKEQYLKSNLKKKKLNKEKVWKSSAISCIHTRNNSSNKNYYSKLNSQIKTRYQRKDLTEQQKNLFQEQEQHSNLKFIQMKKNQFILTTALRAERQSQKLSQVQLKTNTTIKYIPPKKCKINTTNLDQIQRKSLFSFKKNKFISANVLGENQFDNQQSENQQFQTSIQQRMFKECFKIQFESSSNAQCEQSFRIQCQQSLQNRLIKNGIMSKLINQIKQNEFILSREIYEDSKIKNRSTQSSINSGIMQNAKESIQRQKCILNQNQKLLRINLIDWISLICQGMLLKRQTFHLAVIYFDCIFPVYASRVSMNLLFFSCLFVSIKLQERQCQRDLLSILIEFQPSLKRQDVLFMQKQIVIQLKSKLKRGTLVFWIDYFSTKWDQFITKNKNSQEESLLSSVLFRVSDAKSYENYRRLCQLIDTLIMNESYIYFNLMDLGLMAVYLIINQRLKQIKFLTLQNQQTKFNKKQRSESIDCNKKQEQQKNKVLIQIDDNNSYICQQFNYKATKISKEENQNHLQNINIINKISSEISNQKINNLIQDQKSYVKNQSNQKQNLNHNSERQYMYQKLTNNQQPIEYKILKSQLNCKLSQLNCKLACYLQEFLNKFYQKNIQQMRQILQFQTLYLNKHIPIQIDFKIFQQSKNYEDFLRSHTYQPELKDFFIDKILG